MKKYLVEVCQPMWTSVVVEAENAKEAEEKVFDKINDIPTSEFTEEGERYVPDFSDTQEISEQDGCYELK